MFTAFKTQSHRAASEGDQAFDAITPSPRRLLLQTPLRPVHDAHSPHRSPQPAGPGRLPADAALTPGPAGPSCWGALVCLQRPGTPSSPRLTTVTVHRGRSSATPLELRLPDSLSLPSPTLLCPIADRTWPVLDAPCQARRGLGVDSRLRRPCHFGVSPKASLSPPTATPSGTRRLLHQRSGSKGAACRFGPPSSRAKLRQDPKRLQRHSRPTQRPCQRPPEGTCSSRGGRV